MSQNQTPAEKRINAIQALTPTEEAKRITYNGESAIQSVFEVPLEHLIYNAYNGRIKSQTLSFEAQNKRILDAQDKQDKLIIESFLYDSAKSRNERTKESLELAGQQEIGIITKDGVIIDGNRRAMLLSLINRSRKDKPALKFKTIILPDTLADHPKEIITLETRYQMGVDSKVDYNPIEKYIRCKELLKYYNESEIADQMAESTSQIHEWLSILDLMEDYLKRLQTPEDYTRLEKREGHFVDLHKYLKAYRSQSGRQVADWNYLDEDVTDLKHAYFDYIRLGIPVANSRIIARPANKNGFFCHGDIWKEFVVDYKKIMSTSPVVDLEELILENTEFSISELIERVDKKWKEDVEDPLDENIFYYESVLGDKLKHLEPLRLLKRVKGTLYQIDLDILAKEMQDEHRLLISEIETRVTQIKNLC